MQRDATPRLGQIGQIAVTVSDLERAVGFYRDKVGLAFLFQVPNMAFFDCDGVRLMLGLPEADDSGHRASILYFKVADIGATATAMQERGVNFTAEPHRVAAMEDHDLWMAFFQDTEGNTMALMSEVSRSANQQAA